MGDKSHFWHKKWMENLGVIIFENIAVGPYSAPHTYASVWYNLVYFSPAALYNFYIYLLLLHNIT